MNVEGHRVVIEPDPEDDMSSGRHGDRVHIPDTAKDRAWRSETIGTFHQAGPLADLAFMVDDEMITAEDLVPGKTRLLFVQYCGVIYKEHIKDGRTFWFMQDADILAIL